MIQLGQIFWNSNVQSGWPYLIHLWTLFPRLPIFFLWSKPSTSSSQFQHLFLFQGSKVVFLFQLQEDQQSTVVCISTGCCSIYTGPGGVVWLTILPISNWKGKTCFCGFFHALLLFNLYSVALFTQAILRIYENEATVHLVEREQKRKQELINPISSIWNLLGG